MPKKKINNNINLKIIKKLYIFKENELFAFKSFTKKLLAINIKTGINFSYFFGKRGFILILNKQGFGN